MRKLSTWLTADQFFYPGGRLYCLSWISRQMNWAVGATLKLREKKCIHIHKAVQKKIELLTLNNFNCSCFKIRSNILLLKPLSYVKGMLYFISSVKYYQRIILYFTLKFKQIFFTRQELIDNYIKVT